MTPAMKSRAFSPPSYAPPLPPPYPFLSTRLISLLLPQRLITFTTNLMHLHRRGFDVLTVFIPGLCSDRPFVPFFGFCAKNRAFWPSVFPFFLRIKTELDLTSPQVALFLIVWPHRSVELFLIFRTDDFFSNFCPVQVGSI